MNRSEVLFLVSFISIAMVSCHKESDWVFFGDSITVNNRFQKIVSERLHITYQNDAVSGACIATGREDVESDGIHREAFVTRSGGINELNPKRGIFIFGGTNDWYYNVPIGVIADTGTTTYYGAYKRMLKELKAKNPGVMIVAATMIQRGSDPAKCAAQKAYAEATKEVCAMFGVPCYDAFARSGITYNNIGQYTLDNVHPKAPDGDNLLADGFANFIDSVSKTGGI